MMSEALKTRGEYIERIKCELLGPGSEIDLPDREHELISVSPKTRYSIGVLFTKNAVMGADNDDSLDTSGEKENDEGPVEPEETEPDDESEAVEHPEGTNPAEEDNLDEEVSLAAQNKPSSMGMTFFVKGNAERIVCDLSFATYRKTAATDCRIPLTPPDPDNYEVPVQLRSYVEYEKENRCLHLLPGGITRKDVKRFEDDGILTEGDLIIYDELYKLASQMRNGFVREPHHVEVVLDLSKKEYVDDNKDLDKTKARVTALRRRISDEIYSVTVMLVNDSEKQATGARCLFQPEISVSTQKNDFVFCEYSGVEDFTKLDSEEQSLALQFRNRKAYGTGMGTSVSWDIDESGRGVLKNDFFPHCEVPSMDFNIPAEADVSPEALSMKVMSDLSKYESEKKIKLLGSVINSYDDWIKKQEKKAESLDAKYKDIAGLNIAGCRQSCKRMESGLKILQQDRKAYQAFELANRAMYMQRVHLKIQQITADRDRFPGDEELSKIIESIDYHLIDESIEDKPFSWRPFQIAFMLMSIEAITSDSSVDRNTVDLIWFPTGGGKTEAYLGLTAFTIFYRRLNHLPISDGTTVIMRYTLRLLAAQQFTRASTLICACEYIRRDAISKKPKYKAYPLGNSPITIGLWIGREHTPNDNNSAKFELGKLREATVGNLRDTKDRHNKFQVLKCPWCGTKMVKEVVEKKVEGIFGYRMRNNSHFELFCPQQDSCYFGRLGTLPIQIVDEELYDNPPTLLFGTVDKFAMLPWNKRIGSFFGVGTGNRAPELIIQDELHLISGPLGTMVGLYETAVDTLCEAKGVKAKIVASTATIRRAKDQCSALYNRPVNQFPHPALDAEDSFFAREKELNYEENKFGRMYIGLMPSGKTKAMMEVRTIAALMQTIKIMDLPDDIRDKFWTLTVYFNSLKDLGKCHTLVEDDVKDFIKRMAFRTGTALSARRVASADELTSRVSTTELNETLDKLEKVSYSKENIEKKRYPSNILLATNMISVGIDVARLNVMLLVGQPKLTSEYIQASSRIGRSDPGVAFAMYDGSKSRDRSHYEQFKQYHESFYRYVEPTGATPFSKPARDRALHAVVIALLRLLEPDLTDNAAGFSIEKFSDRIDSVKHKIIEREKSIVAHANSAMTDDSKEMAEEIDVLLEKWQSLAEDYGEEHFSYGEKYLVKGPEEGYGRLMKVFNTAGYDTTALETMTSMRNVDVTISGNVLVWEK